MDCIVVRGYYYDTETGFYYLQTRYYDPAICRFINADTFATTDIDGLLSTNMFSYCENNPVMRKDVTGDVLDTALDIAFVCLDIKNLICGKGYKELKNWASLAMDIACAAIPFATGGGQIVRYTDKLIDTCKTAKITVVGETMGRVEGFAKMCCASDNLYQGLKTYDSIKNSYGKIVAEIAGKASNAAWLYGKLHSGYKIIDIGLDSSRAVRSSSYAMEKTLMFCWSVRNVVKSVFHFSGKG